MRVWFAEGMKHATLGLEERLGLEQFKTVNIFSLFGNFQFGK